MTIDGDGSTWTNSDYLIMDVGLLSWHGANLTVRNGGTVSNLNSSLSSGVL